MLKNTLLVFFLLLSTGLAFMASASKVSKYSCSQIDDKISNIQSQMRSGYSSRQGERLRDNERSLKKKRSECKKSKSPTSE